MFKLKTISLLLCMLMAMQMLPIQQIGQMLSTNQWTEELPHSNADDEGKSDSSHFQKAFLPVSGSSGTNLLTDAKANAYIHRSDQIPRNHSTDVVSPPPDEIA